MANRNLSPVILLGGLNVNLNHLKTQLEGRYGHILTSSFTLLAAEGNYLKLVFILISIQLIICSKYRL